VKRGELDEIRVGSMPVIRPSAMFLGLSMLPEAVELQDVASALEANVYDLTIFTCSIARKLSEEAEGTEA